MKTVGGWLMIAGSVVAGLVGLLATLTSAVAILKSLSGDSSAYGIGYVVGQIFVAIIILAIAWKLFTKGRSLTRAAPPATPVDGT